MNKNPEENLDDLVCRLHNEIVAQGWWDDLLEVQKHLPAHLKPVVEKWFLSAKIASIHSEVSDLLQELRSGNFSNELDEAQSIFIRLAEYCGRRNIKLGSSGTVNDRFTKKSTAI